VSIALKKILVATDGSKDAALAIRAAIDLSNKMGAELHVVHAWRKTPTPITPVLEAAIYSDAYERQEAEELLEEQVGLIQDAGGSVAKAHLREGRAADEIAALAEELETDLVVIGSRGVGTVKCLVTGSVSEGVVHLAPCPILVVRGDEEAWPPNDIVIGDDSSKEARRAGELAAGLGQLFGASALLVRAYSLPRASSVSARVAAIQMADEGLQKGKEALEEQARELESVLGRELRVRFVAGDAAAVIQKAEEDNKPALVAIGSRGLNAASRFALGSVSTDTLRAVAGPVLIVPPTEDVTR
jgi:nucleotide-binding universal stress UspA family protein